MEGGHDTDIPAETKKRIGNILEFLELLTGWYGQMKALDRATLVRLMKLGMKVQGLLGKRSG